MVNVISAVLPYIQITLSILLVIAILLQQKSAGAGGAFGGGDNFSVTFNTRRGAELLLFRATIALGILFALSAFIALFI
jgi:protein translocase SecG subunit